MYYILSCHLLPTLLNSHLEISLFPLSLLFVIISRGLHSAVYVIHLLNLHSILGYFAHFKAICHLFSNSMERNFQHKALVSTADLYVKRSRPAWSVWWQTRGVILYSDGGCLTLTLWKWEADAVSRRFMMWIYLQMLWRERGEFMSGTGAKQFLWWFVWRSSFCMMF